MQAMWVCGARGAGGFADWPTPLASWVVHVCVKGHFRLRALRHMRMRACRMQHAGCHGNPKHARGIWRAGQACAGPFGKKGVPRKKGTGPVRGKGERGARLLALDWAAREEGKEKGCWAAALRGLS